MQSAEEPKPVAADPAVPQEKVAVDQPVSQQSPIANAEQPDQNPNDVRM